MSAEEQGSLSARLQHAMERAHTNRNRLAVATGLSAAYLHCLVRGKRLNPSMRVINLISRHLDVSAQWLIAGVGDGERIQSKDESRQSALTLVVPSGTSEVHLSIPAGCAVIITLHAGGVK